MSNLYAPTLKEDPVDAELNSHKLLLRAAMMRKVAAGVYSFLPLGFKVLRKVEQIVREEMDAIGCQEMIMSIIQPGELWHQSGRWDDYGPELFRLVDRHDHSFALSPTQEELITSIIRDELRSYKELPVSLYHIQWKYRDEVRPRFGLLRGREFVMKDAYSFHSSQESLQEHYDLQSAAYARICERLGLRFVPVEADSGQIGGKVTTEFMALAAAGEAEVVHCTACGYAANTEVASAVLKPQIYGQPDAQLTEIETPIDGSITALAELLGISEAATVKALAGRDAAGQIYVLLLPGDHELCELKARKLIEEFTLLDDEQISDAGLIRGFVGPVGLPAGVKIVADQSLQGLERWLTGANKDGYHLAGVACGSDFEVDIWADLASAQADDCCPECGTSLTMERGIEVGQVFQLGTKYSDSMGAKYMDEDGSEQPFIMGCYGWGVTRSIAAVVEQHNDEAGIIWPLSLAPAEVCVIPLNIGDDEVEPTALRLAEDLLAAGVEVVIDDRNERPGVKFAEAELIGWPYQIVVGKRGLAEGVLEFKTRATLEKSTLPIADACQAVVDLVLAERQRYQ
ncbi:MAG: proline--tRNA ligase [Coriobacteriales bacterium]|jgi:prolyl-tRNA synthetase|nr:proline--tRNA ligase [Coriobacteriales bacterium]